MRGSWGGGQWRRHGDASDRSRADLHARARAGSGKTFTMMGASPTAAARGERTKNAGVYVLAARDILYLQSLPQHRHLRAVVSFFEIYG